MTTVPSAGTGTTAHYALFHDCPDDYISGIAAFVAAGQAAGEPVLLAVPPAKRGLIRAALNGASAEVAYLDIIAVGDNPARIIPALEEFTGAHPGRRTRIVGESAWPVRSPAAAREVARYEALLNVAFASEPVSIMCAYDTGGLDKAALDGAIRTHTHICEDGQILPSHGYDGTALADAIAAEPLPGPPDDASVLAFTHVDDLPAVRRHVSQQATQVSLPAARTQELILAVHELASNTLLHGGGPGTLRTWHDPGAGTLICEVSGPGHLTEPLAGQHPPTAGPRRGHGHGLYLINQLCDLTETRTGPGGTTTRLHMRSTWTALEGH